MENQIKLVLICFPKREYLRDEVAKVRLSEENAKFWNSENKEMPEFHFLSRDKIDRRANLFEFFRTEVPSMYCFFGMIQQS